MTSKFPYPLNSSGSVKGFCGISQLMDDQKKTLTMFRKCSEKNEWNTMHKNHYDWWMFPIDEHASTMNKYVISPRDATRIRDNPDHISQFREGVEILMRGWGWDVKNESLIESPATSKGQKFTGYAVRLWKAGRCMQILQQDDYFKSLLKFARLSQEKGHSLRFSSSCKKNAECISLWLDKPVYSVSDIEE